MKFAYEANAWGGVIGNPNAVTDLGTGFYVTPGDVNATLATIAAAGYTGIELFDGNLLPFEESMDEFTAAARGAGLEVVGVYSGGHFIYRDAHADELARFDRSIALASAAGARHYVVGGGAIRSTVSPSISRVSARWMTRSRPRWPWHPIRRPPTCARRASR